MNVDERIKAAGSILRTAFDEMAGLGVGVEFDGVDEDGDYCFELVIIEGAMLQ